LQLGFVASWQAFRNAVREKYLYQHRNDELPEDFFFATRFNAADYGSVWKQCVGFFDQLFGYEPTDLRMQVQPPTTKFDGLYVFLAENHRQAVA
jgi:hypothetical protein